MKSRATSLGMAGAAALAALLLPLATGCPQAARWRDAQIAQSQQIAQGQTVTPPAQPISVAADVRAELPLDDSFVITEYSATPGNREVTLAAISAWNIETTALWLTQELQRLDYESGENPSEILNGVEYLNSERRYQRLVVKATLNTADQCLVRLEAAEE